MAAAALRANDELLRGAIAFVCQGGTKDLGVLRDARRDVANAGLHAEELFQRLMSEHRGSPEALDPIMVFLVYTRRIAASTAALALAAGGATATDAARAAVEVDPRRGGSLDVAGRGVASPDAGLSARSAGLDRDPWLAAC